MCLMALMCYASDNRMYVRYYTGLSLITKLGNLICSLDHISWTSIKASCHGNWGHEPISLPHCK